MRNIREIIAELEAADRKRYGNPGEKLSDLVDWKTTENPEQDVEEEDGSYIADSGDNSEADEDIPADDSPVRSEDEPEDDDTIETTEEARPDDLQIEPVAFEDAPDVEGITSDVSEIVDTNDDSRTATDVGNAEDDVADPEISDVLPEDDRTPNEVEDSPEQTDPADEQLGDLADGEPEDPTTVDQQNEEPDDVDTPEIADASEPQVEVADQNTTEPDDVDSPDIEMSDEVQVASADEPDEEIDDVEMPDLGDMDAPTVSVASMANGNLPSVEKAGFQGFNDLPAVTEDELKQQEIDDPSVTLEEKQEKQFAWGQQISENLAADLAQEITPMFDQLRDHATNTTHNYVQEQILLNTLLRARS